VTAEIGILVWFFDLFLFTGVGPLQGIPAVYERGDHRVHEHVLGRVLRVVQERVGRQESTRRGEPESVSGTRFGCLYNSGRRAALGLLEINFLRLF